MIVTNNEYKLTFPGDANVKRPLDLWKTYDEKVVKFRPNTDATASWGAAHLKAFRVVPVFGLPWTCVIPRQDLSYEYESGM